MENKILQDRQLEQATGGAFNDGTRGEFFFTLNQKDTPDTVKARLLREHTELPAEHLDTVVSSLVDGIQFENFGTYKVAYSRYSVSVAFQL